MLVFWNRALARGVLVCSVLLAAPCLLQAGPFSSDLLITGSADFDDAFALANSNVTQTGSMSVMEGGTTTTTTFNLITVTGADPLLGTLTDTGDGFGITADSTATYFGEFQVGVDVVLDLQNNSLTDTYTVTFRVDFSNSVDSEGADGYSGSEYTVDDSSPNELFFTDILSDTFFGDEFAGVLTGTFGDLITDIGTDTFDVTLAPGASETLDVAYTLEGGAFDTGSVGGPALFSAFLSVDRVTNDTLVIPEPSTFILSVFALLGLGLYGRRRRKRE